MAGSAVNPNLFFFKAALILFKRDVLRNVVGTGRAVFAFGESGIGGTGAETFGGDLGRASKGFVGFVFEDFSHDLIENWGSASHAGGNIAHGGVVIVAHPDGNKKAGSVA